MNNYLMDTTCKAELLNKMPAWAITAVFVLGAVSTVLCNGTELVKEVKPLIQPFVDNWKNDRMANTVIDQDYRSDDISCHSEVEVVPALSVI